MDPYDAIACPPPHRPALHVSVCARTRVRRALLHAPSVSVAIMIPSLYLIATTELPVTIGSLSDRNTRRGVRKRPGTRQGSLVAAANARGAGGAAVRGCACGGWLERRAGMVQLMHVGKSGCREKRSA